MGYVTKADLIARYGEEELIRLTDRAGAGVIDDAVLNVAIADVDAEVDAHLASRYTLPLAEVPSVLTRAAATIAFAELHTLDVPATLSERVKWARGLLKQIGAGDIRLGDANGDGAAPAVATSGPAYTTAATPAYAAGGLADFVSPVGRG